MSMLQATECNLIDELTRKPKSIEQTGVPIRQIETLVLKHLSQTTDADVITLSKQVGLSGNIIDQILQKQKNEALVEVRSDGRFNSSIRYGLTTKGRNLAHHEIQRDGYLGPAPISIEHYNQLVLNQTTKDIKITLTFYVRD